MKNYLDLLPSVEIVSHYYTSTETLMVAIYSDNPDRFQHMERIPVGYSMPGKEVVILDEFGKPVPIGEPGEIVVRSAFICSDIQGQDAHLRLGKNDAEGVCVYHTRDMGRIREDGMLEHLGRLDRQVKINGVRIDPFIVEQCIESFAGVESCNVLGVEKGGRLILVAAYVSKEDLDAESLWRDMETLIPLSQRPSLFIRIPSIPKMERGKPALKEIDRMVREQMSRIDQAKGDLGPTNRSEVGTFLLKIWSELLPGIAVDEKKSLYGQGADSLLILKLVFRINETYATSFTISDIYSDSRLECLAARIDAARDKGDTGLHFSDLPALQPGERVPMSFAQRRMWMLHYLLARPSSYHNVHLISIPSGRTPEELKGMLHSIAERHGILRTRLWEEEGGFWQEELSVADWALDWAEVEVSSQEELGALFSAERDRPFDLSKGLLWRVRWVRSSEKGDQLFFVFHHAITDEWSTNLFFRELGRMMYGSFKPSELPRPLHSYTDFARWQHWAFSKGLRVRLESYWRERLSGLGDPVVLEADQKVPDGSFGRRGIVSLDLGSSMQSLMEDYCRGEGLSRFSVWMAVWQVLQRRLGKGEEVVLATPVSERDRAVWQDVLGMFLNTLPIRIQVDEGASFRDFSNANHRLLAGDLAHGGLPYEDIIRLAERDLGFQGQGLPQVMFVLHGNLVSDVENREDLALNESQYAKNPISLHLRERDGSCRTTLRYDADIFLEATAEKLILRFESVARQVLANPDMRIADINILLPGELERLHALSGKDNVVDYPDSTLQGIFRETAERYPNRPAVIEADGRETSYQELQRQVDQIACFLGSKGVTRDVVVAVHMRRSSMLVAALFGILEAGGAFMLLEPSMPMDRLCTMAEQSRVLLILTEESLPVLPGFEGISNRTGDILSAGSTPFSTTLKTSDPTSLAYVIFTSGSTGVPKGAMVEHRHIINRLSYTRDALGFSINDRALQKSPLSFDVYLTELLLPMFTGGAIVLADPVLEIDMQRITDLVVRHNVTYLHFAPPVLKAFLEIPDVRKVNGILRMIRCGGESLSDTVMHECLSTLEAVLFQSYGPAETAVTVTLWRCRLGHGYLKPPIGRPNPNVNIRIMDAKGRMVPPGMPGELWIGGAQVGRGYINNGEETRMRFVDDPIEPGSGRRYYRTGDLARFLPDGNILFLGRMDDQMKVRGIRIELGDVTAALLRCEGVRDAVVLGEPDGEGSNRLRAWVTAGEGYSLQESGIRTALSGLLPRYMIPFRIHVIASMPVTPHGKTDHRALREHPLCQEDESGDISLKTPTERWLASLWTQLLGIDVSHGDRDFFRLGGHSLLLIRMVGMIRKTFGITLDMKALFQHSLLHEIAGLIDAGGGSNNKRPEIEFSPMPLSQTDSPLKLYVMIGGHGLLSGFTKYKILAEKQAWPINVSALPDPEVNAGRLPRISFKDLTTGYAEAILAEHIDGPIILMGECFGGIDAHAIACYLQDRTTSPIHVILLDTTYSRGMKRATPPDFLRPGANKTPRKGLLRQLDIFRTQKNRPQQPEDEQQIQDLAKEVLRLKLFDPDWYLAENNDVAVAALDPVFHYLHAGWKEGRRPSPWFCAET